MPGSELCLEGPACTADKSMCLCIRQRDTSHTQPVPSPALDPPPGRAQAGLWQPLSQGHSSPPGWEHRAAPSATPAGRSSPLETAVGSQGCRAQRPHRNPPGDHYRQRGLFKAEGGRGTLPAPQGRHDTPPQKYCKARRTGSCEQG